MLKLKVVGRNYVGNRPSPEDWAEYIDNKKDFTEEFLWIYNNNTIPEANNYSSDVLDNTYLNMEVALTQDDDRPEFAQVSKRIQDANGIPIGTANNIPSWILASTK